MRKLLLLMALAVSIYACTKQVNPSLNIIETEDNASDLIPVEKALDILNEFLAKVDMPTKSGKTRTIMSVSTKYVNSARVKSGLDTTEMLAYYIVNFDDNQGFAILGAEESLPEIVTVTENGNFDPATMCVIGIESECEEEDSQEEEMIPPRYSEEDGDYYCSEMQDVNAFVSELLCAALELQVDDQVAYVGGCTPWTGGGGAGSGGGSGSSSGSGSGGSASLATVQPMLTYSWGQQSPYYKYCYRYPLFSGPKQALVGCSNVALAMIMAYNEYPTTMVLNGVLLDWSELKMPDLSSFGKECAAQLCGGIFNTVPHISGKNFTLVTPTAIRNRMQSFQYSNVNMSRQSGLDYPLLQSISAMLAGNKPVFISMMPPSWEGHSWVIDGAQYSPNNSYLLHFNWGWEGDCNGYFHVNCLNPVAAAFYDEPYNTLNTDPYYDDEYNWHLRVITYNIPESPLNYSLQYGY